MGRAQSSLTAGMHCDQGLKPSAARRCSGHSPLRLFIQPVLMGPPTVALNLIGSIFSAPANGSVQRSMAAASAGSCARVSAVPACISLQLMAGKNSRLPSTPCRHANTAPAAGRATTRRRRGYRAGTSRQPGLGHPCRAISAERSAQHCGSLGARVPRQLQHWRHASQLGERPETPWRRQMQAAPISLFHSPAACVPRSECHARPVPTTAPCRPAA